LYLTKSETISKIGCKELHPNANFTWLTEGMQEDFAHFLPIGTKEAKKERDTNVEAIFKTYSGGVKANRDEWVYDFNYANLVDKIQRFIETYNSEVDRWIRRRDRNAKTDDFVTYNDTTIKWSRDLKLDLQRGRYAEFAHTKIRSALYRPFCQQYLFFDRVLNEEVYAMPSFFPNQTPEQENSVLVVGGYGRKAFS
jgi:predicted helicase